jgi:hypothetical protein
VCCVTTVENRWAVQYIYSAEWLCTIFWCQRCSFLFVHCST